MFRKIMIAVLLFGAAGAAVGAGTFASFSASTTNQASTFATGTLTLSNKVGSGTACLSSGTNGDNLATNAKDCDVLFSTLTNMRPGDDAQVVGLTIAKAGSLDAETFKYSATCTNGNDGNGVHGAGLPCTAVETYIQEYTTPAMDVAVDACVFPVDADDPCDTAFGAGTDALSNLPTSATDVGGLLTGSRYFKIGVQMPDTAGNNMQGRKADFSFTWSIT